MQIVEERNRTKNGEITEAYGVIRLRILTKVFSFGFMVYKKFTNIVVNYIVDVTGNNIVCRKPVNIDFSEFKPVVIYLCSKYKINPNGFKFYSDKSF